jgi:hypothetical protein
MSWFSYGYENAVPARFDLIMALTSINVWNYGLTSVALMPQF